MASQPTKTQRRSSKDRKDHNSNRMDSDNEDHSYPILVTTALLLYSIAGAFDTERESRNRMRRERYKGLTDIAKRRRIRKIPRVGTVAPSRVLLTEALPIEELGRLHHGHRTGSQLL
jgi:hypothetical protein